MGLFADYDIEGIIAEGGMATVYRCVQTSLKRPVAVKVLSQKLLHDHPEIVRYFEQESLIITRLAHPNIVHVIDRGISGGFPYFVMEYVDGIPLNKALKKGKYDVSKQLDIVIQIAKALAYAHKNGVIHRDIKPANILLDTEGNVHVADFGIAQLIDAHAAREPIMRTIAYMSPEQKAGSTKLTAATDIYSFGIILYEMFTGQRPPKVFRPPSQINPATPLYLDDLLQKCLQEDPKDRFASAVDIKDLLLESMWGAHLQEQKKKRALNEITDIQTRFAILDIIQETRFGAVYLCENTINHKKLVMKKVLNTTKGSTDAKTISGFRQPNIVDIYGVSSKDNAFIIVMEYLAGGNLKDRLAKPWPWRNALKTYKEICEGLAFAHKNKIIHGNLRPSNILFFADDNAKVSDFGLDEHYLSMDTNSNWYTLPNEARSERSDIFSAGVILFEMLTGLVPNWKHGKLVANNSFRTLPFDLQDMLARMLEHIPKDRYRSFDQIIPLVDELLNFDKSKALPRKKRSLKPLVKILLVVLLISLFMVLILVFPEVPGRVLTDIFKSGAG